VREFDDLIEEVVVRVGNVPSHPQFWYARSMYHGQVNGETDMATACEQVSWALSTSIDDKESSLVDALSGRSMFEEHTLTKRYLLNDEAPIQDPGNGEPLLPRILYVEFYRHVTTGALSLREARLACARYKPDGEIDWDDDQAVVLDVSRAVLGKIDPSVATN